MQKAFNVGFLTTNGEYGCETGVHNYLNFV